MNKVMTGPNTARAKPKILVVDDDQNVTATLARILRDDAIVLLANDGEAGLNIVTAHRDIDLLVLDVTMPQYDALELLVDMTKCDKFPPLVLFSGWRRDVLDDVARLAKYYGFQVRAVLEKPVDGRQIVRALNQQSVRR